MRRGDGGRYERLSPADLGLTFDALFERHRRAGFRGLNITFPYKERVVDKVQIDDPTSGP